MKNTFMAAIATLGFSAAAASAADLSVVGYGEYAVEADAFETGAGVELGFYDRLTVTPMLIATHTSAEDFEFNSLEIDITYGLNDKFDLYVTMETDSDFEYEELTVGASFNF